MSNALDIHRNREQIRNNQHTLSARILEDFRRTTSYGTLLNQLDSLVQSFFEQNLESWDIIGVTGKISLSLDFSSVDFSRAEVPSQGMPFITLVFIFRNKN